jgi:hypothetical protein
VKPLVTMRSALEDPQLLGDALPGESWFSWRSLLIASMGEPLVSSAERDAFRALTGGREHVPGAMVETLLSVAGRRSGKTKAMAVLSTYLSCLVDWSDCLSLGERGLALFLAPSERQAAVAFGYTAAIIDHVPLLRSLVVSRTAGSVSLKNGVDLEVQAASWRRSRGGTAIAITLDECAFFMGEDSANSDTELMVALRPSLATTGGVMALTSSPADMQGVVYRLWKRHYGPAGERHTMVVQSDSRSLNPLLSQKVIDRAFEDDAESAAAEFGGKFRVPLTAYLQRSIVERATAPGVLMRPFVKGFEYVAFADPAGGSGRDSYTMAVGHVERRDGRDVAVLDVLMEAKPPFDPDVVTAGLAEVLRAYSLTSVVGDAYAGDWPKTSFGRCGIDYAHAHYSKSEIYLHVLPLFSGSRVDLLDLPRLADQLCALQRKSGAGGRESVDHPKGGHDDMANSACGVLWRLSPARAREALVGAVIGIAHSGSLGDHPDLPRVTSAAPTSAAENSAGACIVQQSNNSMPWLGPGL